MLLTIIGTSLITIGAVAAVEGFAPSLLDRFKDNHSVSDITASFHSLHQKLLDAVDHHNDQADAHASDAAASQLAARSSQEEAARAALVADKIGALIA